MARLKGEEEFDFGLERGGLVSLDKDTGHLDLCFCSKKSEGGTEVARP